MLSLMLSKEYLVMALIKAKYKIFSESFITVSELVQFIHFMQKELNNRELSVVITSSNLSREDFNIVGNVIIPSEKCCFDVDRLHDDIKNILNDEKLILQFFIELESRKLKTLEILQTKTSKPCTENKLLSLVLPKASGNGISNLKI